MDRTGNRLIDRVVRCFSKRHKNSAKNQDNSLKYEFERNLCDISYIRNYSDERYKYGCDFYLVNYDMFVEIYDHWSHNTHFFDEKLDRDELKMWKAVADHGNKEFIDAIETWTRIDIKKRNQAKKNNIRYVVLWNADDVRAFIQYLHEIGGREVNEMERN